jgi:NAD(P)-dependent dehydrogenase (short-subunit alcohol dehydrogenase family)
VEKVVKEVFARLGGVDIFINNVGGSSAPNGGTLALTDDDWQQTFNAIFVHRCPLRAGISIPDAASRSLHREML